MNKIVFHLSYSIEHILLWFGLDKLDGMNADDAGLLFSDMIEKIKLSLIENPLMKPGYDEAIRAVRMMLKTAKEYNNFIWKMEYTEYGG
jgi:hypothetical protein